MFEERALDADWGTPGGSAVGHTFTLAEVRDLANNPHSYLRRQRVVGGGFGYPQLAWRYGALRRFHESGREARAIREFVAQAIKGGVGPSRWKTERLSEIATILVSKYVRADGLSRRDYRGTEFSRDPVARVWRGHALALPLGLLFNGPEGPILRVVWTEKGLLLRRPGTPIVISAILAYADASQIKPAAIEVYQLREGDYRVFPREDLETRWPRLEQLLDRADPLPRAPAA